MRQPKEYWTDGQDAAEIELQEMGKDSTPEEVASWFLRHKDTAGWKGLAKIYVKLVQG